MAKKGGIGMVICLIGSAILLLSLLLIYAKVGGNIGYPKHIYMKMLCSSVFLLAGILFVAILPGASGKPILFSGGKTAFVGLMILLGLGFGFLGDLCLDVSVIGNPNLYLVGIGAFALNHLCYLIALFRIFPFSWLDVAAFLLLVAVGIVVAVLFFRVSLPAGMLIPGTVYYLVICAMLVKAASFLWQKTPCVFGAFPILFFLGALLFFLSDVTLVGAGYGDSKFAKLLDLNGFLYFPGQLLCAAACGFLLI